jgi:hypothetical protein
MSEEEVGSASSGWQFLIFLGPLPKNKFFSLPKIILANANTQPPPTALKVES